MARRKRVEGPSIEELRKLEEGFAAKPAGNPFSVPPIAQVAAEAAAASEPVPLHEREEFARDRADAQRLRDAEKEGRLAVQVPVAAVVAEALTRDRMLLDQEEMEELTTSIRVNGLRMPIEVFELPDHEGKPQFGLISGFRRLMAIRDIFGSRAEITAIIRHPQDARDTLVSMVEENEVRADLTHYERGRIASLAASQGTFTDTNEAVGHLYHAASKAKRSKIRSFAAVHEELGDMLVFPQSLTEKNGLRLANALRLGFEAKLRAALATGAGSDPVSEWQVLEEVIARAEKGAKDQGRGGRPKKAKPPIESGDVIRLGQGATIQREHDAQGFLVRFRGDSVNAEMIDRIVDIIRESSEN